jgi:Flp pilus assembly protein TadB
MERLVPKYVRQIQSDLYWAAFMDGNWKGRSAASVLGRQVLLTGALGFAAYLALGSPVALAGGLFIGWSLGRSDLRTKAETARLRIAQELPEFVQLMAAESASGAALETVIRRAANGTGFCAAWFRTVFEAATGRALFSKDGENGLLRTAAERSGHSGLISLAIQLGFVGRGVQVQSLLKSLAQTFADEFIAQAETRAEKLGSSLGVMSAIFYFMPFVITILIIVGVPLIQTISGQ